METKIFFREKGGEGFFFTAKFEYSRSYFSENLKLCWVCSLAYDTYNKDIKWFSKLNLRLVLEGKSIFRRKKGDGKYFFSGKIRGQRLFFRL